MLSTAATGAGKTSTFWIPIFFESAGITILIVPLKDLGAQMSSVANGYGLSALDVTRETLDDKDAFNIDVSRVGPHAFKFFMYSARTDLIIR